MLASEGRLLLLGPVQDGKLQLAWIDPPTDPQTATLTVTSAGVSFATGIAAAYPATFGGFLLVDASPFHTAFAEPPIANNSTLEAFPVSLPNGSVVAASHTTLVGLFVDSSVVPFVTTLTTFEDAGTAATGSGAQVTMGFEAPSSLGPHRFTSTRDGSVLWTTNRVDRDEAGTASSSALVLRWLVPDATGQIDPNPPQIEIATYASGDPETIRAGQSALIDSSSAITTMLNPTDPAATLVRAVKKTNGVLELQSGNAPLPFAPSAIGVAATRKFGLVLTPGATFPAQNVSLHVYAPSCG
jgi:hypothetical protein